MQSCILVAEIKTLLSYEQKGCHGKIIQRTEQEKYLDINVDLDLTFSSHCDDDDD